MMDRDTHQNHPRTLPVTSRVTASLMLLCAMSLVFPPYSGYWYIGTRLPDGRSTCDDAVRGSGWHCIGSPRPVLGNITELNVIITNTNNVVTHHSAIPNQSVITGQCGLTLIYASYTNHTTRTNLFTCICLFPCYIAVCLSRNFVYFTDTRMRPNIWRSSFPPNIGYSGTATWNNRTSPELKTGECLCTGPTHNPRPTLFHGCLLELRCGGVQISLSYVVNNLCICPRCVRQIVYTCFLTVESTCSMYEDVYLAKKQIHLWYSIITCYFSVIFSYDPSFKGDPRTHAKCKCSYTPGHTEFVLNVTRYAVNMSYVWWRLKPHLPLYTLYITDVNMLTPIRAAANPPLGEYDVSHPHPSVTARFYRPESMSQHLKRGQCPTAVPPGCRHCSHSWVAAACLSYVLSNCHMCSYTGPFQIYVIIYNMAHQVGKSGSTLHDDRTVYSAAYYARIF